MLKVTSGVTLSAVDLDPEAPSGTLVQADQYLHMVISEEFLRAEPYRGDDFRDSFTVSAIQAD